MFSLFHSIFFKLSLVCSLLLPLIFCSLSKISDSQAFNLQTLSIQPFSSPSFWSSRRIVGGCGGSYWFTYTAYVTEEDEYAGYRIPAGSTVISNIWAISRNEEVYPDAHLFKPERFLSEGVLRPDVRDPLEFVFGFGRRICPGKHIAISTITMIVASMLSTLTIEKAIDEAGHPIEPTLEYNTLLVTHPLPFKCLIKPRSKEAVNLIRTRE
ncbi:cytochrome P450 [Crucibulum laeve]|uniref:Cytochrome P450 n=1 Tax=Crucibulum laeve TaxID=68775 RepID=A0A5C3MKT9_9AGAR|nr:cytochrome P450 [Crucibulum laeve]